MEEAVPGAFYLEALFAITLDTMRPEYLETAKSNFLVIARGGESREYLFLTCYADYAVSEYLLGSGANTLTVAYDRMGEAHAYELYMREYDTGQFGAEPPQSRGEYEAYLLEMVIDAERSLAERIGGYESVLFLAPMGAHNAIAVEAWQVIAQWDVQAGEGGVLNAVRYGTPEYDPEQTQTLASLSSRITTATTATTTATSTSATPPVRIADTGGLEEYYRDIGAYDDITPGDGSTATFTPAQPPAMPTCAGVPAVPDPRLNPGLVRDCTALLDAMATLAGTARLDWNASTTISSWEGVSLNASSTRVTGLDLDDQSLDGTIPSALGDLTGLETLDLSDNALSGAIPAELGRLWDLRELRLSGNSLIGCIPLELRSVPVNDLGSLGLPYCDPPAPENLGTVSADMSSIVVSWDAVVGAGTYRVEYRVATSTEWLVDVASITGTSHTVDELSCGTEYGFRVRSYGDGVSYEAVWGLPSAALSAATGACAPPEFDAPSYSFSVREDAATSTLVGTVSATSTGGLVTYAVLSGNEGDRFAMGASSGDITVAGALDHEAVPSYRLTVEASDARGGAATTTVEIAVIDAPDDPPPSPEGLSVSLAEDTFTLSWDAVAGAALYEAQHRIAGSGEEWASVGTTTAIVLTHSREGDLTCGTPYEFRVRSYGDGTVYVTGWGEPSAAEPLLYDSTYDACSQPPVFGEPGGYTFSVAEDTPTGHLVGTVTATDPDEGDTVTFEITAGDDAGAFAMGESTGRITVADELDYETSPSYSLTVEAGDDRGGAATTSVDIVVTNVIELPGRPQNLRATQEGPWLRLEWDAPDDPTVTGYQILRREPAIHALGVFEVIVEDTGVPDTIYVDTIVAPETQYVYRVKAVNTDGVGPQSGYVSITTGPPTTPPAPSGLSASSSEGAFTVMWEALNGAARYEVEWDTADGNSPNATTTVDAMLTITPEDGPVCGSTYEFRVRAYGDGMLLAAAWGGYSDPASATTGACPSFGAPSYTFLVLESAATGTVVGTVTATDPDEGDTVSYEITAGNEGGEFEIGESSGEITLTAPLVSAAGTTYSLSVEASDGQGGVASVPVTVTVAASGCSGGIAVADPGDNAGLVRDCETLLGLKDALARTGALNWNGTTAITSWDGVTVAGVPPRVTKLQLRSRGLTGVIPPGLGELSGLQVLNLQLNRLTGGIPRELGGLSNLNALWIHENRLTGEIPAELGNLSNLIWMAVSDNELTGPIPSELGGLSDLSQLWLQGNRLSGGLPVELGGLRYMIILQLQDNLLSGPIPPEWEAFSGLSTLNLSGNPLEGCLPPTWRSVSTNDFGALGLPYCGQAGRVPAPQGVSASLSGETFTITWSAVAGAGLYEVQHRISGSVEEWLRGATSTAASLSYSPEGGVVCETTYELRVRAYGDGVTYAGGWGSASGDETVTTGACSRDPEFTEPLGYSFTVAEDAATSTLVGTVSASDPDESDVVRYSITAGNEAGRFSIGEGTGEITVAGALDHETTPTYTLGLEASDGRGGSATTTAEIAATDVPEDAPVAPGGVSVTLSGGTFTVGWEPVTGAGLYEAQYRVEGAGAGWSSVGTTTATVLTYSPEGGPACGSTYELRVRAYGDGVSHAAVWGAASGAEPVTTYPCNREPGFNEPFYSFSVPENAATSTVVGTVSATDPDAGDVVRYKITAGNEAGRFSLGDGGGEITVIAALDHATTPSYSLTIKAGDGRGGAATTTVAISVIEDSCTNGVAVPRPADNPGLVGDCSVLLSIRDTLAGDATLNWSTFTTIGDWDGVTVGGSPARATALNLFKHELSGAIPAELGRLSKLADLQLAQNSLTGALPGELGSLAELERLSLSGNRLTRAIPPELGGLTNLRQLYLNSNQLEGAIPAELGGLSSLERLSLYGNRLTGEIPTELGELTKLRQLSLGDNRLEGAIPAQLGSLPGLELLSLQFNLLTGAIPPELGGLSELRYLYLHGNGLTGPLPAGLGRLSELQTIWLHRNRLTGGIPSELGGLTNLISLLLFENRLTGEMPPELGGLTSLRRLSLSSNLLTGAIPWNMAGLSNLEHLGLSGNTLEGCVPAVLRSVVDNDVADLGLPDCTEDGPAPAPGDLSVSVTVDALTVTWRAVTGASQYEVQHRVDGTGGWDSVGTTTDTLLTYSPADGPVCGTSYEFRARSYGDASTYAVGWGPESDAASASGLCMPTGLSAVLAGASGSDRGIDLSWTAPVGSSVPVGYRVDRWGRAKDGSVDLGWETLTANTGSTATGYRDTGDNGGTAVAAFLLHLFDFTYRVRAVHGDGTLGPWAVEVLAILPQS